MTRQPSNTGNHSPLEYTLAHRYELHVRCHGALVMRDSQHRPAVQAQVTA